MLLSRMRFETDLSVRYHLPTFEKKHDVSKPISNPNYQITITDVLKLTR